MAGTETRCRVCGGVGASLVWDDCRDYVTGDRFAVQRCDGCGVAFTVPAPSVMERYYASFYRQYTGATRAVLHWMFRRRARRWHRLFEKPGRALEIGCGDGTMLRTLRDLGWRVVGVERTAEMAAHAHAQSGVPVFVGELDGFEPGARFDLIVLFQVLEHMSDPLAVLRRCAELLTPDGRLVIGVPNVASWQAAYGGPMWFHLDVPRHLFHFSPTSLSSLLERAGMEVAEVSSISPEHDPYGWVQSVLNKVTGHQNALTKSLMGKSGTAGGRLAMLAGASVLAPVGFLLALLSWGFGRGAIIHVMGQLPAKRWAR